MKNNPEIEGLMMIESGIEFREERTARDSLKNKRNGQQ